MSPCVSGKAGAWFSAWVPGLPPAPLPARAEGVVLGLLVVGIWQPMIVAAAVAPLPHSGCRHLGPPAILPRPVAALGATSDAGVRRSAELGYLGTDGAAPAWAGCGK